MEIYVAIYHCTGHYTTGGVFTIQSIDPRKTSQGFLVIKTHSLN